MYAVGMMMTSGNYEKTVDLCCGVLSFVIYGRRATVTAFEGVIVVQWVFIAAMEIESGLSGTILFRMNKSLA